MMISSISKIDKIIYGQYELPTLCNWNKGEYFGLLMRGRMFSRILRKRYTERYTQHCGAKRQTIAECWSESYETKISNTKIYMCENTDKQEIRIWDQILFYWKSSLRQTGNITKVYFRNRTKQNKYLSIECPRRINILIGVFRRKTP